MGFSVGTGVQIESIDDEFMIASPQSVLQSSKDCIKCKMKGNIKVEKICRFPWLVTTIKLFLRH